MADSKNCTPSTSSAAAPPCGVQGSKAQEELRQTLEFGYTTFSRVLVNFGVRLAELDVVTFVNVCDNNFPRWRQQSQEEGCHGWLFNAIKCLEQTQKAARETVESFGVVALQMQENANAFKEVLARLTWRIADMTQEYIKERCLNNDECRLMEQRIRLHFYVQVVTQVLQKLGYEEGK